MPPREFAVGLGFRPGTSAERILSAIREVLGDKPIRCLATLDRRAAEPGIRAAAAHLAIPVRAYTNAELAEVRVPNPSTRTNTLLGTPSVAEAAAILAANGPLTIPKRTIDHIVLATALHRPARSESACSRTAHDGE
ncbi:cobalamin biosynthesis protein [Nocardia sp. CWNU-33]|uniref:cobalamin biosynthesis protein n=1 Tax=Nocardia sp. CWNU-33 TaxID=3392117 RepID=UPI00398EC770